MTTVVTAPSAPAVVDATHSLVTVIVTALVARECVATAPAATVCVATAPAVPVAFVMDSTAYVTMTCVTAVPIAPMIVVMAPTTVDVATDRTAPGRSAQEQTVTVKKRERERGIQLHFANNMFCVRRDKGPWP